MPWRGTHYYRSVRVNGRPRNEYIGGGPVAAAIAGQIETDRLARERDQAQIELDRAATVSIDEAAQKVNALADQLVGLAMAAAGFHRHHRGNWRKRRGR